MELTEEQQAAVAAAVELQQGHTLKIEACAGSGKTALLTAIARACPKRRFLYLAFNRAIVQEARQRFPANVQIYTTHALAYLWFSWRYGRARLAAVQPQLRPFDLEPLFPGADFARLTAALRSFQAFLLSAWPLPQDEDARLIFEAMRKGQLPLIHDFYLKLWQLEGQPRFRNQDCVLLDEAQDSNAVTQALLIDNDCARIVVGDSHQGIYGFRGAVNALQRLNADKTLSLSVSFRSAQGVLDQANYFLQRYAEDYRRLKLMRSQADLSCNSGTQAYIARTNAGLIEKLSEISDGDLRHTRLLRQAQAIFGGPLSILAFKNHDLRAIEPGFRWLTKFKSFENLSFFAESDNDPELAAGVRLVEKWGPQLRELYRRAQPLAVTAPGGLTLTTGHSAKGLEWDQVELAADFPLLSEMQEKCSSHQKDKHAPSKAEFAQELNLYYVSLTRARHGLQDHSPNAEEYRRFSRWWQRCQEKGSDITFAKAARKFPNKKAGSREKTLAASSQRNSSTRTGKSRRSFRRLKEDVNF